MPTVRPEDFNLIPRGFTTAMLIRQVQRQLKIPKNDFTEFEKNEIIQALNAAMEAFVAATGCLRTIAIIRPNASQQNYRLPFGLQRVHAGKFYTGANAQNYNDLIIEDSIVKMQAIDSNYRGQTGTPQYLFPAVMTADFLTLGFYPIPTTNGSAVTTTGLISNALDIGSMASLTGTHKATGYDNSDFLVDNAGRDLSTLGAIPGYPVYNTTRGAAAIIRSLGNAAATNDKVTADLPRETKWVAGDAFRIPLTEYGLLLDGTTGVNYVLSSGTAQVANLSPGTGNILLDLIRKPLPLSQFLDDQICEIQPMYQGAIVAKAVFMLSGNANAEAVFTAGTQNYETAGRKVDVTSKAVRNEGYFE